MHFYVINCYSNVCDFYSTSLFSVEVAENSLANTLIKSLPVINKPRGNFPIGCRIDRGNDEGIVSLRHFFDLSLLFIENRTQLYTYKG